MHSLLIKGLLSRLHERQGPGTRNSERDKSRLHRKQLDALLWVCPRGEKEKEEDKKTGRGRGGSFFGSPLLLGCLLKVKCLAG